MFDCFHFQNVTEIHSAISTLNAVLAGSGSLIIFVILSSITNIFNVRRITGTRTGVVGSLDEKERREAHIPIDTHVRGVDLLNLKKSPMKVMGQHQFQHQCLLTLSHV
jgi:hypothetical protein